MKGVSLAVKFACELIAFGGLAYWGVTTGPVILNIVLGVGAPLAAIFVWAQWCAPRAPKRLRNPTLTVVELTVFVVAAIAIFVSMSPTFAVIYLVVAFANAWLLHQLELGEA